ncbi:hypothetical protein [Massilia sp. TSP1-1-2]|uniref:hypothetical protein n=1 Tax=Massilia sp. TSP1-1-2 TaxID=2804649 RepID=UPI003CF1613D
MFISTHFYAFLLGKPILVVNTTTTSGVHMHKTVAVSTCIALLAGCAMPTLDQGSISALQGKTVVRAFPPPIKMMMVTPASAAVVGLGLLGGVAAAASGAKAGGTAPFDVEDPGMAISATLAERLAARYNTKTSSTVLSQPMSSLAEIATRGQALADYSLQVSTRNLLMANYMTAPSRYRVSFIVVATLIDNKTKQSVASGVCVHQPENIAVAGTYEDMLANNGERSKREVAAGAQFCAQKLQRDMFAI